MAENYPLVEQQAYGRTEKRVGFLGRRPAREEADLPRVAPHQVRVFRVGEEYVEDHGQFRSDDPTVVHASSVTVVDRSIEVPVVVETRIPSAEAGDFTLRTTFYCTVTDPCAVVRDGVTDVEALLLGHLRAVPGLVESGSDRSIVDSLTVRERIEARLTAYHEMRPTAVSGLRARHGMVEVLTPAELADALAKEDEDRRALAWKREREERQQEADLRRTLLETELAIEQEKLRSLTALRKESNRQREKTLRREYERDEAAVDQDHDLTLRARGNRAVRAELAEDYRLVGSDPDSVDFLAYRDGDINADELAQRMERRRGTDREAELQRRVFDREEEHWKLERDDRAAALAREAKREREAIGRQEQTRRWDLRREDALRRRTEERSDAERVHLDEREWAREVKAPLLQKALDRGLFDSVMNDAGEFINSVTSMPPRQRTAEHKPDEPELEGETGGGEPDDRGDRRRETDRTGADDDFDLGGTDAEASLGH
ncbi:MAG: hypothetical protein LBV60_04500 [Streptomyces sp.]|jgi:hypothetical protein|nr:hypothetical protein [Streptomyces sp.]